LFIVLSQRPSRSNLVGGHVIAGVTAEDPDGGPDRQGGEFAELLHHGAAFLAATHEIVFFRCRRRTVRVIRRHEGSPKLRIAGQMKLAAEAFEIVACVFQPMSTNRHCRAQASYPSSCCPSNLPLDRLMK
jgi:hypothetical protein